MGFLLHTAQYVFTPRTTTYQPLILSVLEHGSAKHRQMALDHLVAGLLEFATNEQGSKSVTKALKEGGKETLDRFVKRMAESTKGYVQSPASVWCVCLRMALIEAAGR